MSTHVTVRCVHLAVDNGGTACGLDRSLAAELITTARASERVTCGRCQHTREYRLRSAQTELF